MPKTWTILKDGNVQTKAYEVALCGEIHKIKRTRRGGHALIEFGKKHGSQAAASRLNKAIKLKPELKVSQMVHLGLFTKAEIKDIDPTVSKEDMLDPIKNAILTDAADRDTKVTALEITEL